MAQYDKSIKTDISNLQKKIQEIKKLDSVQEVSNKKAVVGNQQIVRALECRKKLIQEVYEYENSLGKTEGGYEQLKLVAEKCAKSAGTAAAALIDEIKHGMQEGFSNLLDYSKPFQSGLEDLKSSAVTLQNAFAAMFAPFLSMAGSAMSYLQGLADYIAQLFEKIGQCIAIAWGQKTYIKAVKQTNDAFKEGKKAGEDYLSPLDKINQIQSSNQSVAYSTKMFEEVPIDSNLPQYFNQIFAYVQKIKDSFAQVFEGGLGDWARSVSGLLSSIVGSITSVGMTIGRNLFGGIEKYFSQNKEGIKKHLVSMFAVWEEINALFSSLFQSIAYIFEAFADKNGQQFTANIIGIFSSAFMGVAELLSKFFRDLAGMIIQPFVDNQEAFRTALDGFLGILAEVTTTVQNGVQEVFADFNVVYDEHFKPFFDSVTEGLSNLSGKFLEFWNGIVQPILQKWSVQFNTLWNESLQPFFSKLVEMSGCVADALKIVWENVLMPLIDWIVETVLPVVLPVIDGIVAAAMGIIEALTRIAGGIIDVLSGIITYFVGVFTGDWKKALDGIVKILEGTWEQITGIAHLIITIIENLLNGLIYGVNNIIRGINGLKLKVPDWVTELTGITDFGGFNIPEIGKVSIPRLATGTVIPPNREFLAMLGDNQREAEVVSPLSTMKDAFKEAFAEMGSMGGDDKIVLNVTANVDGRTLFGFTQEYALDYYRRTGRSPYPI